MIKRLFCLMVALLICISSAVCVFANDEDAPKLFDGTDKLTESEEQELEKRLSEVSAEYKVEIAVVIIDVLDGLSAGEYAEQFYDEIGCGYGEDKDGVLLFIASEDRKSAIVSDGLGDDAVTVDEGDSILEDISSDLGDDNYADAINTFIDECEYQIDGEINGFPFDYGMNIVISLAIGFVVAFIVTGVMKGQLKSVRMQRAATQYTRAGSMQVTNANDLFLYSTVTMREKKNDNDDRRSGSSSRNVSEGSF